MKIVNKMIIFMVSTILFMALTVYFVSHILGIVDRGVTAFVAAMLLCIYILRFGLANDKTMWMKL